MIGTVIAFAGMANKIPVSEGWLECDGRFLPRTGAYAALFDAIGILYGEGDGITTFNIPDFRGYFLRGVTGNSNVDRGLLHRIASAHGTPNEAGSYQGPATAAPMNQFQTTLIPDHQHGDPTWNGKPGQFELATQNSAGSCRGPGGFDYGPQSAPTTAAGGHSHMIIAGGDEETRPVNKYVHWLIKAQ
jgi:microcystin-dependent protein